MGGDGDGTPFGRYRLIDLLGRGGMGEVWRAHDPVMGRFVALKMLPENYANNPVSQERFRREARAAAGLDERHVIPIHDFGEIDGRMFVTMKLIKGRDLQERLAAGPLPPATAVHIVEQVAAALDAAHQVGLVHRDVKPSNIFVEHDDFAYLIDFGIARAAGEDGLTSTGSTIGTWAYMAPERFNTGVADAASDIYALTCVLHQALTGAPPFPAGALEQIAVAHMTKPPPQPSGMRAEIPTAMDDVIATGMAKEPGRRYATATDLARAARAALSGSGAQPSPVAEPQPPPEQDERPPTQATWQATAAPVEISTLAASSAETEAAQGVNDRSEERTPPPSTAAPRGLTNRVKILAVLGTVLLIGGILALHTVDKPSSAPLPSVTMDLPFTGLSNPAYVAIHLSNVYVTDSDHNRVLALLGGSRVQTELRFAGSAAWGIAVDDSGTAYVTDAAAGAAKVIKVDADFLTQSKLPLAGIVNPKGVAVNAAGDVYVAENVAPGKVVKLKGPRSAESVLPFSDIVYANDVAVDPAGAVYVTDTGNKRVLRLAAGSTAQTVLPFTGLQGPEGVATDVSGAVYVTDRKSNKVLKLASGSTKQTVLPFTDLYDPHGIAVDSGGNVYVVDSGHNRVVKLPQKSNY